MGQEMNILTMIWGSGFVVKLVLILLIVASVGSWAIVIKKWRYFRVLEKENQSFYDYFIQAQSLDAIADQAHNRTYSCLAHIFFHGHKELQKMRQQSFNQNKSKEVFKKYFSIYGVKAVERAMKRGVNEANEAMSFRLGYLASVSSVAPFVGLFGTVWGIINSFTGLSDGGGSIEAIAPGIAEALVATAVGLAAAIPANWFYNIFATRVSSINGLMESFEQDFLNLIERTYLVEE